MNGSGRIGKKSHLKKERREVPQVSDSGGAVCVQSARQAQQHGCAPRRWVVDRRKWFTRLYRVRSAATFFIAIVLNTSQEASPGPQAGAR